MQDTGTSGFGTDLVYNDVEYVVFNNVTINLATTTFTLNGTGWGSSAPVYGTSGADTLNGTQANDTIYGEAANDTINGGYGDDYLDGGPNQDAVNGGAGNDILVLSYALDTLTGGAGADTFLFTTQSTSDTITDFSLAQGDKLDISDILQGYDPLTHAITDFIQITTSGSNSIVKVDVDGGANNFVQMATLNGTTGLTDEAALVSSGNLIVV